MTTRDLPPTGHHRQSSRGRSLNSRVIQLSAFALSFILIALLVVTSSRAAFVAQNDNIANTVSSATVDLTDDDSNTAMFLAGTLTNLMPGTVEERCITVTYTGNMTPLEVKMYIASALPNNDLADYLNLTVDIGPAISQPFRSCTGFVSSATLFNNDLLGFATAHPNYATTPLATGWVPTQTAPGNARTFRFKISVQDVPAAEGKSTTFGFSWETRTS
jgi:hypothetical protein